MNVAVVTTHNEEETIGDLIVDLSDYCQHIVVVDENSTDDTIDAAIDAGAQVHKWFGGIGPCLLEAWHWARKHRPDRIVQIDAGGSHHVYDLERLLASTADLVLGSRFVAGGVHTGPIWRRLGSRVYGHLWRRQYNSSVRDWTSGYRVFSPDAINHLIDHEYRATMHGWQAEVLGLAHELDLTIEEVPITYTPSRSSLSWRVAQEAIQVIP